MLSFHISIAHGRKADVLEVVLQLVEEEERWQKTAKAKKLKIENESVAAHFVVPHKHLRGELTFTQLATNYKQPLPFRCAFPLLLP
jgi:hypothetical protein